MPTDFELVDGWRAGDQDAGAQLFDRHFRRVLRFFRSKVDDGVDDLVQRTFLACVERQQQFRKEARFSTYLLAIARRELLAHFRRRRRDRVAIDPTTRSVADLGPSPSVVAAVRQEDRLLLSALRHIPIDAQIVLELHYWEDMTSREVAEILEVPHGTVRSRLRRAKQQLRSAMSDLSKSPGHAASTMANLDRWAAVVRESLGQGA